MLIVLLRRAALVCIFFLLPVILSCTSGDDDDSGGAAVDDTAAADDTSDDDATPGTNEARVFPIDPVATPEMIDIVLDSVAADAGGTLTSALDENGVRKLMAWSCVDEGETNTFPGIGEQRICTLRQRANKDENGSFLYDDWQDDAQGINDPENIHAEVTAFYHAQKVYDFVTSPEVGVFDLLPGRHENGSEKVPLNLIVNYRYPVPVGEGDLVSADSAFFISAEDLAMGMDAYEGLLGLEGDVLVFGQGASADFAYSGETVYHEFGHAITNATASLGMIDADEFGLTNMPWAMDEGLANTFASLVSGQDVLNAYLSDHYGDGFTFYADNGDVFPNDLMGISVADGNVIFGTNHDIAAAMTDAGFSTRDFTRVLLHALMKMADSEGRNSFGEYADDFLEALADDGFDSLDETVRGIFEARGLFAEARVIDVTDLTAADDRVFYIGSAAVEPWNTTITIEDGEGTAVISTTYFQVSVTASSDADPIAISAVLLEPSSSMTAPGDWNYKLFGRKDAPVLFEEQEEATIVTKDFEIVPAITSGETPYGEADTATFVLDAPEPSATYYFIFVNTGTSDGLLAGIDVTME